MFQVQHYRKIQTAVGLRNVTAHNMRHNIYDKEGNEIANEQKDAKWYDPEMAHHNRYSSDIEKPDQVLKKRADRIQDAGLKRKPQKNASFAIEGVFSASPEFNQEWRNSKKDNDAWKEYLVKSEKWAAKTFGKENVLHVAMHMDEKTPHLHVLMTPIMRKDGRDVYSSSNFLGGRSGLRTLQTEYHKSIGKKYNLDRGVEGSRASHEWIKGLANKEKQVNAKEIEVHDRANKIEDQQIQISNNKHLLYEDLPKNLKPEVPKNPLKRSPLYVHNSSDGLKKDMPYKAYMKYETESRTKEYIQKLSVLRRSAEYERDQSKNRNYRVEKELSQTKEKLMSYTKATPEQLRNLADRIEATKTKNRSRTKSKDHDLDRGLSR